ncbi:MAG TPA: VOC family protein [Polyangiaceae bacterium]|nr:VOC family protein [Polyangiaceae bacterium]
MAIQQLTPYLNFDGTAAQAIALYERALGAKTEGLQRFGDMPGSTPEAASRVLHAMLRIGAGMLMISDTQPGTPFVAGSNVHVCLDFDDADEMGKKFDALAAGGQVTMPLQDTFWGARFGMAIDAYGIHWMFNCTLKKS